MKTTVIHEASAATSVWPGGTSKQYYIYPPSASYAARDFAFRMSMATSASEAEAAYSSLAHITRHLVMLEGTAHVFHKGHYDLVMRPYAEIDVFDGGWESSAAGKVTDFNLMTADGVHGNMSVLTQSGSIPLGGSCETCSSDYSLTAFFCGAGTAQFCLPDGAMLELASHELLLVEAFDRGQQVNVLLAEAAKLIRMDVCCRK